MTLSTLDGLVPFLQQYPIWVRGLVALWIIFSATLLIVLLVVPRNTKRIASTAQETLGPPRQITSSYSHWEAVQSNEFELDCSPYRMVASSGIYTYSRIVCEALAELRSNMRLLAQYHVALESPDASVPEPILGYKAIQSYIAQEKIAIPYGPEKKALERLIKELQAASLSLLGIDTKADLIRWQSEGRFTIDDLFVSNGFLDWIMGYLMKDKLTPAEMSKLGPSHDRAFPYLDQQSATMFAVRELKHYAYPEEGAAYLTIPSAFD